MQSCVAVGTPVTRRPRPDPHMQHSCMRLLPQIVGVEAQIRIQEADALRAA
jgi:hypothetical protein